jgi:hypothetical protein
MEGEQSALRGIGPMSLWQGESTLLEIASDGAEGGAAHAADEAELNSRDAARADGEVDAAADGPAMS